jgi:hypothetical protein
VGSLTRGLMAIGVLWSLAVTPSALAASACNEDVAVDRRPKKLELDTRYPGGPLNNAGEAWVQLAFTVTPGGTAENVYVVDAVGSQLFQNESMASVAKSRWEPAQLGGKPVAFHRSGFAFEYRISDRGRAGVHNLATRNYDIALANRKQGEYRRSADLLLTTMKMPLNLYEFATTSYGLTVSYLGLGDRRRALRHIRHTVIGEGAFADSGQRSSALAMAAELAAQDNSLHESLCNFELLKDQYPNFAPGALLQGAIARAERDVNSAAPVRTEVEIVEPVREEVAPSWVHRVLRRSLAFSATQGTLKSARVVCPTAVIERAFPIGGPIEVDLSVGACTLIVYGAPGARFVLEER